MIQEEIVQGDLLFHAVHGLCRVDEIARQKRSDSEVMSYSLVPKVASKSKERFIIAGSDMKISGFHVLITVKEANEILAYLQAGKINALPPAIEAGSENEAWGLAQSLLSFSSEGMEVKDQRKRQKLERAARGLIRELSLVFEMTLKDTMARVRKSLGGSAPRINTAVLSALARAGED